MTLLLCLSLTAAALATDVAFPAVVEARDGGVVNWTDLRLEVTSRSDATRGAWKDRRVQEQDAVDRLAPRMSALAEDVAVTPERSASDVIDGDAELGLRLTEALKDWRVEETRYHATGGVEMDAALDLRTWLRPALASLAVAGEPPERPERVTGLVVDARGLPFEPSVAPTVLTADGTAIVRAQLLSEGTLRSRGPVLYVLDPADPRAAARAGGEPLFAQATAVKGGALVLAAASPAATDPALSDLVASGRVVIVMDPP